MLPYLILSLAFTRGVSAACYAIDKSMITTTDYQPCNSISGSVSMCCAINRGASSIFTPDTCLSNGLCQNVFTNETTSKPDTNYWREGCSESAWDSKYCLAGICTSSDDPGGDAPMTPCDGTPTSEKWCCGRHNTACCGTGQEIVLAATLGVASTSATSASSQSSPSSSPSSTSTQPSAAAASTSPPASAPASSSSGLSTGAIAGIAIGCAALAVFVVVALFYYRRKKKRSPGNAPPVDYATVRHQGRSELPDAPKQESAMPFLPPRLETLSRPEMQGHPVNPRSELP